MPANQKASTTMLWVKNLSSTTYNKISKRVLDIDFINRNKKTIIMGVALWLIICLGSLFLLNSSGKEAKETFFNDGVLKIQDMSTKTGPALLGKDILGLNVIIGELMKSEKPAYCAILNHEDKIVAHNNPDLINQPLPSLSNGIPLNEIDDVKLISGTFADDIPIVSFTKDVTFSGVKIGVVSLGLDFSEINSKVSSNRLTIVSIFLISTILLILGLFYMDKAAKNKIVEAKKAFEGMKKIGPYILLSKIAQGGMAELFLADYIREDGFRRTVAIKRVLPHLSENQDFIKMFIREARLAAILQHPNIVQIFDFGKIENAYFIAMEFINGKNLAEIMGHVKKGLPVDLAMFIISKISTGLYYSHSRKDDKTGTPLDIVHRDISPQNMLISFQGEAKISDFGISKASSEPSLTQAGVIKGKLSYLSPEQALGKEVNHQVDIYALGLVFYEILSGKRLYKFANDIEAIRSIPKQVIPQLIKLRPDIPEDLNHIVMKCLEKDRKARYQTAQEIVEDLSALRNRLNISFDESSLSDFMNSNFEKESINSENNDK